MEATQAAMAPVQPEELMSRTVECRYCGSYRYKITYYWMGSVIVAEGECGRCGVRGRSFETGKRLPEEPKKPIRGDA
jgi:hypothetical protein